MKKVEKFWRKLIKLSSQEQGSALVIVALLLALLTVYVSASLTLATTDTVSSNFEEQQQRGFFTAYSKLEQMSRDFSTLFTNSPIPTYDSMCRVVVSGEDTLNNFRILKPDVSCPEGSNCSPGSGYSSINSDPVLQGRSLRTTGLFDLGWVGGTTPFCMIDVCNPSATPVCNFPISPPSLVQVTRGDFAGLQGFTRRYRAISTVTAQNAGGSDVQITRDFDNILLPLFQFGIFSDADFELYLPPNWQFGGWVHTNGDFYLTKTSTQTINFAQYARSTSNSIVKLPAKLTVARHLVIGASKTGIPRAGSSFTVFNGTSDQTISTGSAINGALVANCNNVIASLEAPPGTCNSFTTATNNTIKIGVRPLKLPIQTSLNANPIEIIRRGLASDRNPALGSPLQSTRYYYKPGIRVTLADYQVQLPRQVMLGEDPSQGTGPYGGVQLDGPDPELGLTVGAGTQLETANDAKGPLWYYQKQNSGKSFPIPRGYQPKANGKPTGARVNGNRIHGWIKVEAVRVNAAGQVSTFDITQEILNLGVTVPFRANTGSTFHFPRGSATFPASVTSGLDVTTNGPYLDEHSIIHLQRFAVPYIAQLNGITIPTGLDVTTAFSPALEVVGSPTVNVINYDYYASMSSRRYITPTNSLLNMFGIKDDDSSVANRPTLSPLSGTNNQPNYSETQPDAGGYYTDAARVPVPTNNPLPTLIDFNGDKRAIRAQAVDDQALPGNLKNNNILNGYYPENANLPKQRGNGDGINALNLDTDPDSVLRKQGETTWQIGGLRLIPFPINIFDSREGVPNIVGTAASSTEAANPLPPVSSGLGRTQAAKAGIMNLVEIDMGNLGRLLRGDFNNLFSTMSATTPYRTSAGGALTADALRDSITVNQDNGWVVYLSDRRGDEPLVTSNPNNNSLITVNTALTTAPAPANALVQEIIGNGSYQREDVVWSNGGTASGSPAAVAVIFNSANGCTNSGGKAVSNNQDQGKSPQDANNDCVIQTETSGNFSETAPYTEGINEYPVDSNWNALWLASDFPSPGTRRGNLIALTMTPTVPRPGWSLKPPVGVPFSGGQPRVELFRRGVRLVNATSLFPTGAESNSCGAFRGLSFATENPTYVFGHYNVPVGEVSDTTDVYPGLTNTPSTTNVTTNISYQGDNFSTCDNPKGGCHVPAAILADSITLLSSPSVGTSNSNWSSPTGDRGWLDSRSFLSPHQSLAFRPARNTVYRFAFIGGYTPSWYSTYWSATSANVNQGPQTGGARYESGSISNLPRLLEDWGPNASPAQLFLTYSGSLIQIYKSQQGNGAYKRSNGVVLSSGNVEVEPVFRPPNRDWIFDADFNSPCSLPPASPLIQLTDFKGFQRANTQR
jgi:hypothetical protein